MINSLAAFNISLTSISITVQSGTLIISNSNTTMGNILNYDSFKVPNLTSCIVTRNTTIVSSFV